MIYKITSKQNNKIKELAKYDNASFRNESKCFLAEGFHLLEMALEKKRVKEIYTLKEIDNVSKEIDQYIVTPEILEKISKYKNNQGVVFVCLMNEPNRQIENDFVLYLDGVSDPGNMGTLLRSALAFGYNDVVLSKKCVSIYNEKVIQASQGAIFSLNVIVDDENDTLLDELMSLYPSVATVVDSKNHIEEVKGIGKYLLILGNEAHGIRENIKKKANYQISIDIKNIESLNVAIAGAIFMYCLR